MEIKKEYDPGSHRDPAGRVFYADGRVCRELTLQGQRLWQALAPELIKDLASRSLIVDTRQMSDAVLEHERIPFLSYAYEWPFSLLKKAALHHLSLMAELIPKGFILKDSKSTNIQFMGLSPRLMDVFSIEKLTAGDPWAGYSDFCDAFLYPLMLRAHKNVPYQAWLRGSINGISPEVMARFFGLLDFWRPGVLTHVKLRALLHRKWNKPEQLSRSTVQSAKFPAEAILKNVYSLKCLIEGLSVSDSNSVQGWADYESANPAKEKFVDETIARWRPATVWDIGSNTGVYSRIAARHAKTVAAFDRDEDAVEKAVIETEIERLHNVLPLIMDWADPSPGLGWELGEEKSIFSRGKPDAVLYLALVHHLAVRAGIPIELQLKKLSTLAPRVLIEFVAPEDPMFRRIAMNICRDFSEYTRASFLEVVNRFFRIEKQAALAETRTLYALVSI